MIYTREDEETSGTKFCFSVARKRQTGFTHSVKDVSVGFKSSLIMWSVTPVFT